jgi:adenylate cyclase, class 2
VIEAEIKARVRDPGKVRELLRGRAAQEVSRYRDTYYDLPGQVLARGGRELRVRVVESSGQRRCLVTYKGAVADEQSGSKPETQTEVTDADAMDAILLALGFSRLVAFDKLCANYAFTASGRDMFATLVTVPDLEGTFIEVETMTADHGDLGAALNDVRAVLDQLGIAAEDLTSELYTDAVIQRRRVSPT